MTAWSESLGLTTPIVCAPMGGIAGGELATAVSTAGALGMIGMGSTGAADKLRTQLSSVPDGTRIGIGLVEWVVERDRSLLDLALEARPALLSLSFGTDFGWVERARDAGIVTVTQVADLQEARWAADAGIDAIVARGREGGGHGRPLHDRDPLLDTVLAAVDVPVLAAGAIATADDVRGVLERGAAAAWVGTAFTACPESLASPGTRRGLLGATPEQTVLTSAFDIAAGHAWPDDIPERVVANSFTEHWPDAAAVRAAMDEAGTRLEAAGRDDDPAYLSINAGLGVGELREARPAAAVVASLHPGGGAR